LHRPFGLGRLTPRQAASPSIDRRTVRPRGAGSDHGRRRAEAGRGGGEGLPTRRADGRPGQPRALPTGTTSISRHRLPTLVPAFVRRTVPRISPRQVGDGGALHRRLAPVMMARKTPSLRECGEAKRYPAQGGPRFSPGVFSFGMIRGWQDRHRIRDSLVPQYRFFLRGRGHRTG